MSATAAVSVPVSAMPKPSARSAIARWVALATRSAMPVVAVEQLTGCLGMPATQFSRISTSSRRKLPALVGTASGRLLKTPIIAAVRLVASVRLIPHGMQSGLSRRSTSMRAACGSTVTLTVTGTPSSMPASGTGS